MKLLTLETAKNAKTAKLNVLTDVLFLAPHKESGVMNTCPYADGCEKTCLNTSRRLRFDAARDARIRRTKWFKTDRPGFLAALREDIEALVRKAVREGKAPAVRLNGLSDLSWEKIDPDLFTDFPEVMFYDYTKSRARYCSWLLALKGLDGYWPKNYHLTMSAGAGWTDTDTKSILNAGGTVAIVYHELPEHAINGDEHDARWLDPAPCIVGLKAKGAARKTDAPFVH